MKKDLAKFLEEMVRDVMGDSLNSHDCDNCNAKGMCPLEDEVREFKTKHSADKTEDKEPMSNVFKFMRDASKQKQKSNKDNLGVMTDILNDIFFDGEVPKEVKVQTERIERIVNAKNKLNSNVEELLFATTRFGKKINGNPDFSQVESFALYIEEMNRKMEELIKYYKSQPNKKKVRTKEEFKKDAEEMFAVFIKMIKDRFNLGKPDEKVLSQIGILDNFNTYADNLLVYNQSKNMEDFKVYLAKYLHLESKSIKNLLLLTTPEAEYLLEVFRDVIIRTFMDNEYKEERDAK